MRWLLTVDVMTSLLDRFRWAYGLYENVAWGIQSVFNSF